MMTNCDGLHRRSGIKIEDMCEIHGNAYKECCQECGEEYLRGFTVREKGNRNIENYKITGRYCEKENCMGKLLATCVAFGESVLDLEKATIHSKKSEVTLVLGTSMRVSPACQLPFYNKNSKMILVNLQTTPYDENSTVRSFSKTDIFMKLLMKELNLEEFDKKFDILIELKKKERNTCMSITIL